MKALYSNTWGELSIKMLGFFHDHCYHLYTGKMSGLPIKYKKLKDTNYKYIFVYREDVPNKKV